MYFNAKIYINSCILLSMTTLEEEINYIFRGELSYEEAADVAALREVLRRRGLIPDEETKNSLYNDVMEERIKDRIYNRKSPIAFRALSGSPPKEPKEPEDMVLSLARTISEKYNPKMEITELANRVTNKIMQNPFYLPKFKFLEENNSGLSYKDINDYVYTVLFENNWDVEV